MPLIDEDKKIPFDIHTEHRRWIETKKMKNIVTLGVKNEHF